MNVVEYNKTEAALSKLREKYAGVAYDVSSREGLEAAKTARAELRGYRIELEKVRKEIKAPALKRCQDIDAEAKRITREISALEDPIDIAIKSHEDRIAREKRERELSEERARQEKTEREKVAIDAIRAPLLGLIGKSSAEIYAQYKLTLEINTNAPEYGTPIEIVSTSAGGEVHAFIDRAAVAKSETLTKLQEMYEDAAKREDADARMDELKALRASAEEARKEAERLRFIADVAPVVDDKTALRKEARDTLSDFVLRFSEIPELSPVISAIIAYLKG